MQWCTDNAAQVRAAGMANIARMRRAGSDAVVASRWRPLVIVALAGLRSCPPATLERPGVDHAASAAAPIAVDATLGRSALAHAVVERAKNVYADHYRGLNGGALDGVYRAAAFYYQAELGALLPPLPQRAQRRALDVGCGYGLLLRFLRESGFGTLDGIELDVHLHGIARELLGPSSTIWHGDALAVLAKLTAPYDLVTAYDILEHFDKDAGLQLAEGIRRVLAADGCAVFRTPNMANVLGSYSRCMDLTHQVGFTEQSLTQLLHLAGFQKVELVEPEFAAAHPLTAKLVRSRTFHRELFELQDRAMPRCFDKNLVMLAHA
jgi:2-polyprenyl-3-methyl-5-hydroxy-6-metoxy-1,4-benzoquinol methylase